MTDTFVYVAGPVHWACVSFGERQDGPGDALLIFGGTGPDPLPGDVRGALMGHIAAGARVVVMARSPAQLAWIRAQISVLTAPGGRA